MKRQKMRRSPRPKQATSSPHPAAVEKQAVAAPRTRRSWWPTILAAGAILLSAVVVYLNSFQGTFAYDDEMAIVDNPTIRQLWPIAQVLSPPANGETVSGRPLLNLSLAINYRISGLKPWSYHAANLLIHIAAALLLFGILRRTFLVPALCDRFGQAATPLALASTLLWTVHPLQTESVTYIVQRAETFGGFFYLLTLYCVIRGAGAGTVPFFAANKPMLSTTMAGERGDCPPLRLHSSWPWYVAAVLACLLGTATKEILVTAPLLVLLYDRTFLAGSLAEALRRRWRLYVGLVTTWGLLAYLVFSTGLIARQAELGAPDWWSYARSQPGVILRYLRLSLWPSGLCMSYQWPVADTLGEILPGAIVVGALFAATVWGLIHRRAYGFLGAWFLLILLPTSSILPLGQLAFEHRLYLSLAAPAVLAVAGGYVLCDSLLPRPSPSCLNREGQSTFSPGAAPKEVSWQTAMAEMIPGLAVLVRWAVPTVLLAAMVVALGWATVVRNHDYRSPIAIWQDAVDKRPDNPLSHYNLGTALDSSGRVGEAIDHYREAVRLNPDLVRAHYNLGLALAGLGKFDGAIEQYQQTVRLQPGHLKAHNNLGYVLALTGRTDEAIAQYREALRLKPDVAAVYNNLGLVFARTGKIDEAVAQYHEALRLKPDYAEAHNNLANALIKVARTSEAIDHYQQALRLKDDFAEAHNNLGYALASTGRGQQAMEHYHRALRLKPNYPEAHYNLANLLVITGKTDAAIEHYQRAAELAESAGQAPLADAIRARLELYRAGQPYRVAPR